MNRKLIPKTEQKQLIGLFVVGGILGILGLIFSPIEIVSMLFWVLRWGVIILFGILVIKIVIRYANR